MTFRLVDQEKPHHAVSRLCRVLGGARAGFYAWQSRPPSARAVADQALVEQIRQLPQRSRATYGAPRIQAELRLDHGSGVGRKRVARLMRAAGLVGGHRRRRAGDGPAATPWPRLPRTWSSAASLPIGPTGSGWPTSPTSRPGPAGCISPWSSTSGHARVVGWAMADHLRTELVVDALDLAIWQRRPAEGLVHHRDQGCQSTSVGFGRRCREAGITPSMGSVGDAYDNAMAERFFATLECELLHRHRFRTRTEARVAVFDYLEGCYNPRRRHSALGQLSPADYERSHQAQYASAQP